MVYFYNIKMKDIDITQNLNELNMEQKNQKELVIPPSFMSHGEKPTTIIPFIKEIKYSPNSGLIYSDKSQIRFLINSTGFLDPYGIYLKFKLENASSLPVFIDKNYHNLIDRFQVNTNGNILEEYNEFDIINDIYFDQNLLPNTLETLRPYGFYSKKPDIIFGKQTIIGGVDYNDSNLNFSSDESMQTQYGKPVCNVKSNVREIIIPLMSRFFGFGVEFNNYRFLPLERLPNLELNFNLNFESIRLAVGNMLDMITNYSDDDMKQNYRNKIEIKDVCLITRQLYFDSSLLSIVKSNMGGDLVFETVMSQILHKKSEPETALFKDHYEMFNIPRMSIRRFNLAFYSDKAINLQHVNYTTSKYNRYSRRVKYLQLKVGDENYPSSPLEGDSSTSAGVMTNFYFWNNYLQTLSKGLGNFSNSLVTPLTFSLDWDLQSEYVNRMRFLSTNNVVLNNGLPRSHKITLEKISLAEPQNDDIEFIYNLTRVENYLNQFAEDDRQNIKQKLYNKLLDTNYYLKNVADYQWSSYGRCIYQINLESVPFSCGSFKCGVDTRYNRAMTLSYKFIENLPQNNEEFIQSYESLKSLASRNYLTYFIIDFDYTLRIAANGLITKEF